MPVKVTIQYGWSLTGDRRYSDSESHWLPSLNALDGSQDVAIIRMVNNRMAMCASNVQLIAVRQSLFAVNAIGRPVPSRQRNRIYSPGQVPVNASGTSPGTLSSTGGFGQINSEQPKDALLTFVDGIAGGTGRGSANKYLSGLPDDLLGTGLSGTYIPAGVPAWNGLLTAWLQSLNTGGFAWLGTAPVIAPQPYQIIRWANETTGAARLMLTITGNPATWAQGSIVHVRSVRMAVPRTPTPAGRWRIDVVAGPDTTGAFTFTLANASGFLSANIISPGTVESWGQAFYLYTGTGTPQRATARKRGASAGASRGKSRPRQRVLV